MLSTLLAIALLHWVVLMTPGANVLVVSNLAASGSRQAAVFAGLGVTVVAGIWSSVAVLGVNAIFAAHPHLRIAVQIAGGLYLLSVALRLWRTSAASAGGQQVHLSPAAAFRLGFLTNIMNPKSALFFGSVFATALPSQPTALLLFFAVTLVVVNAFVWHMFLALAFSHRRVQAAYARRRAAIGRTAGALVGVFGARLLYAAATDLRTR
jgi:threonine efflux protein